ncbi:AfsR/SARP family transcriptional regulator [Actinomycetes bacterium KLBMP 9797]
MEFGLLGPVRAVSGGAPVNLGPRKQRLVLAVLLLSANRFVATTSLVRACWLDDPPPTAHRVVHAHVSRLRGILSTADGISIARHGAGYVLNCDPTRIDAHRFRDLVERARASGADEEKAALLDTALALWRGEPLDDVATGESRERLCGGLVEVRLAALQERWQVRLRLGQHLSILDELVEWAAAHPRQQRITGQLMLALYRSGRATDALAVYRAYRKRMAEEFGIDPDAELQRLEVAILRADRALDLPRPAADPPVAAVPVPAQLPPDVPGFAGRGGPRDAPGAPPPPPGGQSRAPRRARVPPAGAPPPPGGPPPRPVWWSSPAPPGWARRRWRCTGPIGYGSASRTGSCT